MICPCGTGKTYAACCQVFHLGTYPLTAEQLMRSRYSAFALRNVPYLIKTQLIPEKDKQAEAMALSKSLPMYEWLELRIISITKGQKGDKEGTVEFIAKSVFNGQVSEMRENSSFKKIGLQWTYIRAND